MKIEFLVGDKFKNKTFSFGHLIFKKSILTNQIFRKYMIEYFSSNLNTFIMTNIYECSIKRRKQLKREQQRKLKWKLYKYLYILQIIFFIPKGDTFHYTFDRVKDASNNIMKLWTYEYQGRSQPNIFKNFVFDKEGFDEEKILFNF